MSAQRFQGKVAVITGGNSGIGLGVAKAYAQEGAQVAITGRNEKTLEVAAKEIADGTLAIQSDAGKVAEIEAAMKKIKWTNRCPVRERRGWEVCTFRNGHRRVF